MMWGYYIIRDRLPFFTLLLYLIPQLPGYGHTKQIIDHLSQTIIASIIAVTMLMGYAMVRNYPIQNVFYVLLGVPNTWIYPAVIEWGIFITITYLVTIRKTKDHTLAATTSILAAATGGWLYEFPIFIYWGTPILRFNDHNTFYLSFQIIALPILLALLISQKWNPGHDAIVLSLLYCIYLTLSITYVPQRMALTDILGKWWHRIPTMLMLYSWITGLPEAPH